ncbi:hypothetical protein INR49_001685 [Caranx melampygus]|nr:hypothetical protein INR49_001685 [Caranx melampygus]
MGPHPHNRPVFTAIHSQRQKHPQDPRFQHLTTATSITATTKPPGRAPPVSRAQPSSIPLQLPVPEPSPPLPPPSARHLTPAPHFHPPSAHLQSPVPLPPRLSALPLSPVPTPLPPTAHLPSPAPPLSLSVPISTAQPSPFPSQHPSLEPNEHYPLHKGHSGANEERLPPTASREFAGVSKDRREKPQGKEKKNEETFVFASMQPLSTERRTSTSPPSVHRQQDVKGEAGVMKELGVVLLKEEKETVQRQGEVVTERWHDKVEDVVLMCEAAGEKRPKGEVKELVGICSPPPHPLRNIDSIVDKHLGNFSSDIQLLLQDESIHYSFPQCSFSASTEPQRTLPHSSICQFSQYVSFYNPCPPIQDYVSSLQESMNSMITEFSEGWTSRDTATSRTDTDTSLASTVSAFVASIRAANTKTDKDGKVPTPCGDLTAADGSASVSRTIVLPRGEEAWGPDAISRQFPDAADSRTPPASHVTLSVPTSASGSVHKTDSTIVLHPPSGNSPHQQSYTLETNRTIGHTVRQTQDNSITRTIYCATDVEGGSSLPGSNSDLTLQGSVKSLSPLRNHHIPLSWSPARPPSLSPLRQPRL